MSAVDSTTSDRKFRHKEASEIVLLCNPRAGGRWKELAKILDSEEAKEVRRIVTDSVDDIAPAVSDLGRDAQLICTYGGDGTVQRIIDHLFQSKGHLEETALALLGGGTMNVTSRWLGYTSSPGINFRHVVNGFRTGDLTYKEVPLMKIKTGDRVHHGFTFGMGPLVRLLDEYERGRKGKVAAVQLGAHAAMAAFLNLGGFQETLRLMDARVTLDDEVLPDGSFSAIFTNVTGQINPGIEPFTSERTRDSFYAAAYSVKAREFAMALPFIARGLLPVDLTDMLKKWSRGRITEPPEKDPRYVNRSGSRMVIETDETIYTVDGEILQKPPGPIEITMGPSLKLAIGPKTRLKQTVKNAKDRIRG